MGFFCAVFYPEYSKLLRPPKDLGQVEQTQTLDLNASIKIQLNLSTTATLGQN